MIFLDTSNYLPKYIRVKKLIEKSVEEEMISSGDKMSSESELTKKYSVSRHTVRKALDLLEREGVIEKRHCIGTFSKGMSSRSGNIGFISISLYDYIFADILSGADNVLHQNGYQIILGNSQDNLERESIILEQFLEKDIDGLIIEPAKSALSHSNISLLEKFVKKNIPVVILDSKFNDKNLNSVVVDDQLGGFIATNYLIELGHSRIAIIYKGIHNPALDRLTGYKQAINKAGGLLQNELVRAYYNSEFEKHDLFQEEIRSICRDLIELERPPTAIFCFNDQIAVLIKEILLEQGIGVPKDISLIGFDDSSLVNLNPISIASVSHPKQAAGEKAAEILLSEIENGPINSAINKIFEPKLVKRDSIRNLNEEN